MKQPKQLAIILVLSFISLANIFVSCPAARSQPGTGTGKAAGATRSHVDQDDTTQRRHLDYFRAAQSAARLFFDHFHRWRRPIRKQRSPWSGFTDSSDVERRDNYQVRGSTI